MADTTEIGTPETLPSHIDSLTVIAEDMELENSGPQSLESSGYGSEDDVTPNDYEPFFDEGNIPDYTALYQYLSVVNAKLGQQTGNIAVTSVTMAV